MLRTFTQEYLSSLSACLCRSSAWSWASSRMGLTLGMFCSSSPAFTIKSSFRSMSSPLRPMHSWQERFWRLVVQQQWPVYHQFACVLIILLPVHIGEKSNLFLPKCKSKEHTKAIHGEKQREGGVQGVDKGSAMLAERVCHCKTSINTGTLRTMNTITAHASTRRISCQ